MTLRAWLVPVSSVSGTAHYMEWSEKHKLVQPACNYGRFNTAYAQLIPHAKFCPKCQDAISRQESTGRESE